MQLGPFLVVAVVVVATPGVDMALVTRNAAVVAARGRSVLARPAVKRALDRVSGVVLIGLGARLALERR
jgi:threonine/homoserine/homoserine lactone efflux protein